MAALVRSVETAHAAFRDGADELVTMWTVYREMMDHPLTDEWNKTFLDEWVDMHESGLLEGVPVTAPLKLSLQFYVQPFITIGDYKSLGGFPCPDT